jgi:hypothetical protein
VTVAQGGTGNTSATAYALQAGGTTSTGVHQSLTTGTSGQLLTSGGASALPSWTTTLSIAQGGTNNGSLAVTAGGVIYTDGSKFVNVGAGTSGQVLQSNGASAPSWATASSGGLGGMQVFTASGTFTIPSGKTVVKVTVVGGGGSAGNNASSNGGAGGTSSVSSGTQTITTVSATGGGGTTTGSGFPGSVAGSNGSTSGATLSFTTSLTESVSAGGFTQGVGCSPNFLPNASLRTTITPGYGYGGGNTGWTNGATVIYGVQGGCGGVAITYLSGLTPGNTLTVTRGAGSTTNGNSGGNGLIIFEY